MKLFDLPKTESDAIELFQRKGVLPKKRICSNGHNMSLYVTDDRIYWRCNLRSCRGSGTKKLVRMRVGNWFEGSRISFVTALRFMYCWSWEFTSSKFCDRELGMNKDTTVDWSSYMREICAYYLLNKPEKMIGGDGMMRQEVNAGEGDLFEWMLQKIALLYPPMEQL